MPLGDELTQSALETGTRTGCRVTGDDQLQLAIHLPDDGVLHFERPRTGGPSDWRVAEFLSPGGGCLFDEPIGYDCGQALDLLAAKRAAA
ncbi:hypothetical protein [Streptomyces olivoreticuli]|uniref:hypothetical protein n=1 Tax=Streptomyces olivoreticuli TaxID=68246 RepID=UPI000E269CC0|nr:hypothetical protein [Streptomyces olivoreticuli]